MNAVADPLFAALPFLSSAALLVISAVSSLLAQRHVQGLTAQQRSEVSKAADAVALTAAVPGLILAIITDGLTSEGTLTWVVVLALVTAVVTVVLFVILLLMSTLTYQRLTFLTVSYFNWGLGAVYITLAVIAYVSSA